MSLLPVDMHRLEELFDGFRTLPPMLVEIRDDRVGFILIDEIAGIALQLCGIILIGFGHLLLPDSDGLSRDVLMTKRMEAQTAAEHEPESLQDPLQPVRRQTFVQGSVEYRSETTDPAPHARELIVWERLHRLDEELTDRQRTIRQLTACLRRPDSPPQPLIFVLELERSIKTLHIRNRFQTRFAMMSADEIPGFDAGEHDDIIIVRRAEDISGV